MTSETPLTNDETSGPGGHHFDKGDSVTLVVGPQKHEQLVHANYIARKSSFSETALKKEWLEGQTRTIALPEDDHDTITDYLNFVYSGKLTTSLVHENTTAHTKEEFNTRFVRLAKLYVLGNKLMDKDVKTAVMKEVYGFFETCCAMKRRDCLPDHRYVNIMYGGLPENDPALTLLLNVYASLGHVKALSMEHDPKFGFALLTLFMGFATNDIQPKAYRWHMLGLQKYLK